MPDSPDYSKYLLGSVRFSLQDMGELAARLGSPMVYDRRGEVQFMSTFDNGLAGFTTGISGTGASVKLVVDGGYRWPYHVLLTPGTTLNKYAAVGVQVGAVGAKKIGCEWVFAIVGGFDYVRFDLYGTDGVTYNQGQVRINYLARTLQVRDENSVYRTIQTIPQIAFAAPVYLSVKVVIDLENHTYDRIVVSDEVYDASAYSFYTEESGTFQNIYAAITLFDDAAPIAAGHVAQVILTVNEP